MEDQMQFGTHQHDLESHEGALRPMSILVVSALGDKGILQKRGSFVTELRTHAFSSRKAIRMEGKTEQLQVQLMLHIKR